MTTTSTQANGSRIPSSAYGGTTSYCTWDIYILCEFINIARLLFTYWFFIMRLLQFWDLVEVKLKDGSRSERTFVSYDTDFEKALCVHKDDEELFEDWKVFRVKSREDIRPV